MSKDMDEKTMSLRGPANETMEPASWSETGGTPAIHGHISDKLKEIYAEVVNQPIPDKLLQLLSMLESKPGGSGEAR